MPAAHVITLGLDTNLNASIRAWFKQFNHIPPIPLTAGTIDTVPKDKASFGHLLWLMSQSDYKNFILIIHGHSDGSGLWLKLTHHQAHQPHTTYHDLRRLMELAGDELTGRELSPADQKTMGVTIKESHTLIKLMSMVQAKGIECIEFRACNLGRNQSSLERFRLFFGAKRVGAPNVHSFFGEVPATTDPKLLATHEKWHHGHVWETYKFPDVNKAPQLVACFELNHESKPEYGGHICADSAATLNAWIDQFIMRGGAQGKGNMAMHGLWVSDIFIPAKKKGETDRYVPASIDVGREQTDTPLGGGWGGPLVRRFIPPLSEWYAKHIVYAKR